MATSLGTNDVVVTSIHCISPILISRNIYTLRKQACSNILKILPPKNENFQIKIRIFFLISAQNIDCGYSLEPPQRGGSNVYHNLCF